MIVVNDYEGQRCVTVDEGEMYGHEHQVDIVHEGEYNVNVHDCEIGVNVAGVEICVTACCLFTELCFIR